MRVPQNITVQVVEETPTEVYLVLPASPAQRGQELSDQDLEAVAGGWSADTKECGSCVRTCPSC